MAAEERVRTPQQLALQGGYLLSYMLSEELFDGLGADATEGQLTRAMTNYSSRRSLDNFAAYSGGQFQDAAAIKARIASLVHLGKSEEAQRIVRDLVRFVAAAMNGVPTDATTAYQRLQIFFARHKDLASEFRVREAVEGHPNEGWVCDLVVGGAVAAQSKRCASKSEARENASMQYIQISPYVV